MKSGVQYLYNYSCQQFWLQKHKTAYSIVTKASKQYVMTVERLTSSHWSTSVSTSFFIMCVSQSGIFFSSICSCFPLLENWSSSCCLLAISIFTASCCRWSKDSKVWNHSDEQNHYDKIAQWSKKPNLRQPFSLIARKWNEEKKIKQSFYLTLVSDLLVSSWSLKTEVISTRGPVLSVMLLMEVFRIWYSLISSTMTLHCSCLSKINVLPGA